MGFIDEVNKQLTPHATKLNTTIASASAFLHSKLDSIEQAIRESASADWNDHWFRISVKRKLKAEPIELAEVPINEIWAVYSIVTDGIQEKSPAFVVTADGPLIFSVIKEGIGGETPGGDIVILPGESLIIIPREEGNFSFTITVIRRQIPTRAITPATGRNVPAVEPINVHDPERDIITSKTGIYGELPGKPELVDPTVP